ncbi:hypothetical protein ACQY0O_006436 [Thecaphora frezii]
MAQPPSVSQPLTIVRPTPLHPLDEVPLNLHPSGTSIGSEPPRPVRGSQLSQLALLHSACNLPVRGGDDEAQEALAKLDRLAKQREKRKAWRKGAGRIRSALHRERKDAHDGNASDSSSSDSIDLSKAFEEVKLKISSLPGHPVVGRVRNAASRARDRIGRGDADSPAPSPQSEEGQEDGLFQFPLRRSIGVAARRLSMTKTPPPQPLLSEVKSPLTASPEGALAADVPSMRDSHLVGMAPESSARTRTMASQNPDLLVVDEEGHEQQVEEQDVGRLRRPLFLPRNDELSPASKSMVSTPTSTPSAERGASLNVFNLNLSLGESSSSFVVHKEPEVLPDATMLSPSTSASSDSDSDDFEQEGSALATDSSDDDGANYIADRDAELLKLGSVSLKHSEVLTKSELKRQRKLMRKELRRQKRLASKGDASELPATSKASHIGHGVGHRVSKGLHYASSQSRNRRAMERYSPNPAKQLQINLGDIRRTGTPPTAYGTPIDQRGASNAPLSALSPTSSLGAHAMFAGRRDSLANSRRSSLADQEVDTGFGASPALNLHDFEGGHTLGRQSTQMSVASSKASFRKKYMRTPHILRRRRMHKWEAETTSLEAAEGETPPAQEDPEKELDHMLGKLAVEQAPRDAGKERYEFDVLYENQRGLLVFGIPKFSPRTLFQWDPSPWTSASNKKSPYNIVNAQLPDPSWEWVYPEWLIDMTGDTDEAGWQYSGNFGRRFWPNIHFPHGRVGLPRTGMKGIAEMNARQAERHAKRVEKEKQREDNGLEALKRSARPKTDKWQGTPDPWTFVRRRRWIRLRRRRPLATTGTMAEGSKGSNASSPAQEAAEPNEGSKNVATGSDAGSDGDSSGSLSGSDEEGSANEDDNDGRDYAPDGAGPSAFLPRRLPGELRNGPDPFRYKRGLPKARRAQRHAKEFTGTIRELKSLLPSILASDKGDRPFRSSLDSHGGGGGIPKAAMPKLHRIDARNPFISWRLVKARLEDGDMAFASATLRAKERRYQQRQNRQRSRSQASKPSNGSGGVVGVGDGDGGRGSRSIPSAFRRGRAETEATQATGAAAAVASSDGAPLSPTSKPAVLQNEVEEATSLPTAAGGFKELTREALIEINWGRMMRVLCACKVDRQRLDLWRLWLGLETLDTLLEKTKALDHHEPLDPIIAGSSSPPPPTRPPSATGQHLSAGIHPSGGNSPRYRQRADKAKARWHAAIAGPEASDVWDVLERKLDDVLLLFEFQSSRAVLLRTLLAVHSCSHAEHVYRDRSVRSHPSELSPLHVHGQPSEMGGAAASSSSAAYPPDGWQRSGLPRLEFFSDVRGILDALPGPGAGETASSQARIGLLQEAAASSLSMLLNLDWDAMPTLSTIPDASTHMRRSSTLAAAPTAADAERLRLHLPSLKPTRAYLPPLPQRGHSAPPLNPTLLPKRPGSVPPQTEANLSQTLT